MVISVTPREFSTILAALRSWQPRCLDSHSPEYDIASDCGEVEPLDADEIDDLCEYLNTHGR